MRLDETIAQRVHSTEFQSPAGSPSSWTKGQTAKSLTSMGSQPYRELDQMLKLLVCNQPIDGFQMLRDCRTAFERVQAKPEAQHGQAGAGGTSFANFWHPGTR